ncbi:MULTISPECIES: hypothetical protein [unclassified Clostridium]|uniref:hypothetical protein n=1 Tax=unclassified Clostridium TaxID=2614128 RepID=UPI0002980215|nr:MULTISPECIES: hypothetical protein [unclassified Clostridium]EKQ50834.1 MAG: hypothetical protein A370_05387 [Clostridium sp. Maddingley MBC34-26]
MNKEMNKLLLKATKYDLGSGLLIALVITLTSTFIYAGIYAVGICVALANFLVSAYTIEKNLGKSIIGRWLFVLEFFLRMAFIVLTILPFRNNMTYMLYYMSGFVSHYVLLIGLNIIRRKGSV